MKHLARHFAKLCRCHDIEVETHSRGVAYTSERRVGIRPIRSRVAYAVAMHELGHILGRQPKTRLDREVAAWEWAHANAIEWSDTMEANMQRSLRTYLDWSRRNRRARKADANHPIHRLVGEIAA